MIIYVFEKTSCIYESDFSLINAHLTKAEAYKAMRKQKEKDYIKWHDNPFRGKPKFGEFYAYRIRTITIKGEIMTKPTIDDCIKYAREQEAIAKKDFTEERDKAGCDLDKLAKLRIDYEYYAQCRRFVETFKRYYRGEE